MAEDENQSIFFQREIYSFHNYDQFNENLNNPASLQQMRSYEGSSQQQFQQQQQASQLTDKYKLDDQEMQLEDLYNENQDNQQQFIQQNIQNPHFNMVQQHQQPQQQKQQQQQQQLQQNFQQSQPNQQQQQHQQQIYSQPQEQPQQISHKLSISNSQSPPLNVMNQGGYYQNSKNNYLISEEAGRNYPLLANIMDENLQNSKLNDFYVQNKVLQGLNCFMLLDNELPRHTAQANNFCDDPNFFIGHFFDEKNKNGMFVEPVSSIKSDHIQTSFQSQQQVPIVQTNLLNLQDQQSQQQSQQQQQQKQQFKINDDSNMQQNQNMNFQSGIDEQEKDNTNSNQNIRINGISGFTSMQEQQNSDSQFLHDFISGYLQQNSHQNFLNTHHHNQHQANPHQAHDTANKGPSKNAFQRSSTSFLDKVTFAVDDILDKQDPNEYPELTGGEDFLMTNLRNYIALEFSYNQESSYFQKFLNSSYQIFLQRLKLLLDQKRMDSKTLLPFVCRFSIEMAEKLLQFIYKCDDKFTMKLFREHSQLSQKNLIKKEVNGSTSPTSYSQQSQKFDSSIIDDDFSLFNKTTEDVRTSLFNNGNEPLNLNLQSNQTQQTHSQNYQKQTLAQNIKNCSLIFPYD